jgi:hypothetical protein
MINQDVLTEKLRYLILMNSKSTQFKIEDVFVEVEYLNQEHTKIGNYEIDIKFDYEGVLEPDINTFTYDIQNMSYKMGDLLSAYVITEDGKIVTNKKGNITISEAMVWKMDYKADELHFFNLSYRFGYDN